MHMEAFKAMGSLPTPMAMQEVFTALQTGTVDGQENPVPVIASTSCIPCKKYFTMTGHVYSPALLIINPDVWKKVSDADKAAFKEAAKVAVAANRKKVNAMEAEGLDIMRKAGLRWSRRVDNAAFQKAVASTYATFNKEFGEANIKEDLGRQISAS